MNYLGQGWDVLDTAPSCCAWGGDSGLCPQGQALISSGSSSRISPQQPLSRALGPALAASVFLGGIPGLEGAGEALTIW